MLVNTWIFSKYSSFFKLGAPIFWRNYLKNWVQSCVEATNNGTVSPWSCAAMWLFIDWNNYDGRMSGSLSLTGKHVIRMTASRVKRERRIKHRTTENLLNCWSVLNIRTHYGQGIEIIRNIRNPDNVSRRVARIYFQRGQTRGWFVVKKNCGTTVLDLP